jgi:hypothetical protein
VRAEPLRARRWAALLLGLALALPAGATPPVPDLLEVGDELRPLYGVPIERGFPWSKKLREVVASETMSCSSVGAPRGRYRLHDGRLWLVGFIRCGPDLGLDEAYGRPTKPMPAIWLSGDLHFGQGKLLCYDPWVESIWQTRVELKVERGLVLWRRSLDQTGHPRLPTEGRTPGNAPGHCRER